MPLFSLNFFFLITVRVCIFFLSRVLRLSFILFFLCVCMFLLCSEQRQTVLFSATQTRNVEDLARISLRKARPLYVGVDDHKETSTVDGLGAGDDGLESRGGEWDGCVSGRGVANDGGVEVMGVARRWERKSFWNVCSGMLLLHRSKLSKVIGVGVYMYVYYMYICVYK